MVKALILDYNGVLVNDEPLHMAAFQEILKGRGIPLTREEYLTRWLGMSDRRILRETLLRQASAGEAEPSGEEIAETVEHLLALKAMAYRRMVRSRLPEVPGAAEFVHAAAERYPIAVASGALRVEVEDGLYRLGVRSAVTAVVSIEDVDRGKPDPDIFLRARDLLLRICSMPGARHALPASEPPASFLVIEDSPPGLAAARAAGMRAVGLLTSCPAAEMEPADLVVEDLRALPVERIAAL